MKNFQLSVLALGSALCLLSSFQNDGHALRLESQYPLLYDGTKVRVGVTLKSDDCDSRPDKISFSEFQRSLPLKCVKIPEDMKLIDGWDVCPKNSKYEFLYDKSMEYIHDYDKYAIYKDCTFSIYFGLGSIKIENVIEIENNSSFIVQVKNTKLNFKKHDQWIDAINNGSFKVTPQYEVVQIYE